MKEIISNCPNIPRLSDAPDCESIAHSHPTLAFPSLPSLVFRHLAQPYLRNRRGICFAKQLRRQHKHQLLQRRSQLFGITRVVKQASARQVKKDTARPSRRLSCALWSQPWSTRIPRLCIGIRERGPSSAEALNIDIAFGALGL